MEGSKSGNLLATRERNLYVTMPSPNCTKKGRVTLLPWDDLSEVEKASFHINPLVWAPKADSWEGRVCLNLSYGNKKSVNEGTDTVLSDTIYKPSKLPDVHSLCEMLESIRENKPDSEIHGGTVDVNAAYQQFSLTTEAAKLRSTIIYAPHLNDLKPVLVVYLVGVFGDTRARHVYNTIGRSLDFKHNQHQEVVRSQTYIDDGILADAAEDLDQSMLEYCDDITFELGSDSVKDEKRVNYKYDLQAIGFLFNLRKKRMEGGTQTSWYHQDVHSFIYNFPP